MIYPDQRRYFPVQEGAAPVVRQQFREAPLDYRAVCRAEGVYDHRCACLALHHLGG